MQIAMIALGSRGDVQPYIALGKGLKAAGHTVRLATSQDFEALVKSHGLEFWLMRGNMQEMIESRQVRELLEKGNIFAIFNTLRKAGQRINLEWMQDGLAACQGMDLLITGSIGLQISLALAEKYHLPLIRAYYVPITPTKAFPSWLLPQTLPNLGGAFNLLSTQLIGQLAWMASRSTFGPARKQVPGLPPAAFLDHAYAGPSKGLPMLFGFSPSVVPMPDDWGAANHITGYWFLDPDPDWTPPAALLDFLQAGPAPVYIGFGSMSSRKPEETAELVIKALKQTNQRALLFSGWGGLQKEDLPDSLFMLDATPHAWLFPRVAAVVHHGGAGTTGAGLRAGVPALVVPFFGDQAFWGKRVHDLGVGPAPIARQKLNAERLARAIQEVVTNTGMRQRAADLGLKIRAEDGVANAVKAIQQAQIFPGGKLPG